MSLFGICERSKNLLSKKKNSDSENQGLDVVRIGIKLAESALILSNLGC